MSSSQTKIQLPATMQHLLGVLRRRIRWYVWLEGLALLVAWLGLAFWLGLAMDYLPVRLGASEMPRTARTVLLGTIAAVALFILYRWIGRRAFARLGNSSLAVLIERRFPQFTDALLTSVQGTTEVGERSALADSMLKRTIDSATQFLPDVKLNRIFNWRPLVRNLAAALLAVLSVAAFGLVAREAFATWTSRLFLLSDEPWPRRAQIEVLGFHDGRLMVAEGSNVVLRVRANAALSTPPPELCTIYYELQDGDRGRVNMSRDGEPREGFQYYRYDGAPFQDMLDSLSFDVVGLDHRLEDYRIEVVPSPIVADVQLDCEFPAYMQRSSRRQAWRPGTSLPVGSNVVVNVTTTKPLTEVQIEDQESELTTTIDSFAEPDRRQFSFPIQDLRRSVVMNIQLLDADGVPSQRPYRLAITAIDDLAPEVNVLLQGISSAITPQAKIPVAGRITDDYQVKKAWIQLSGDDVSIDESIARANNEEIAAVLDLRQKAASSDNPVILEVGQQVTLEVRATDHFDLDGQQHVGVSDAFALDVVTPDELLAMLEGRELSLKRRFEQILAEMNDTRDSLVRLQAEVNAESTDTAQTPDEVNLERQHALRLLRIQRAHQQGEKSQQEVAGVAASFADIREELINNRVDTEERKIRLQDQIVDPLEQIVTQQFSSWIELLRAIEPKLEATQPVGSDVTQAVDQATAIILAMEAVLQKMIELESYNELVDLVREIIKEQQGILEQTKEEQRQQTRSLFED